MSVAPSIPVPGTSVPSGSGVGPGGDQGLGGPQGVPGPNVVSTDTGNIATLGSDNLILVPQSTIWSVRNRSFNAIGNSTFEVDQRNAGTTPQIAAGVTGNGWPGDRWVISKAGACGIAFNTSAVPVSAIYPGYSNRLSSKCAAFSLPTNQASLAAGDYLQCVQTIEGAIWRELQLGGHSFQILVTSSVTPLKFAMSLRDPGSTRSYIALLTFNAPANTYQLISLPNLPQWDPGGNWSDQPGAVGYTLSICIACGSTYTAPALGWNNGNFIGAPGMDQWVTKPNNSTFYIGFVQHEPGTLCTGPIDLPFSRNHHECSRYFDKTYNYAIQPGAASGLGALINNAVPSNPAYGPYRFKRDLAKSPTVTLYGATNGQINTVYNNSTASNVGVTAILAIGTSGYYGWNLASYPAAVQIYSWQHTADTGW